MAFSPGPWSRADPEHGPLCRRGGPPRAQADTPGEPSGDHLASGQQHEVVQEAHCDSQRAGKAGGSACQQGTHCQTHMKCLLGVSTRNPAAWALAHHPTLYYRPLLACKHNPNWLRSSCLLTLVTPEVHPALDPAWPAPTLRPVKKAAHFFAGDWLRCGHVTQLRPVRCEGRGSHVQSPELQCLEVTLNLLLLCAFHPEDDADIGEDTHGQKDRVPQSTG